MLTPDQCRAARALVDLPVAALAATAGLDPATIEDFESRRPVPRQAIAALRRALEGAGVLFVADGETSATGGIGLRLATRRGEGLRPDELTSENDG